MKHKHMLISVLSVLVLVTLGCGLVGGGAEPTATAPAKPVEATQSPEATTPPESTTPPEATTPPNVAPGEEYRSEEGGYAFRAIPGFTVEGGFGVFTMQAPDADPEHGPTIMMMGYQDEESTTTDELLDEMTGDVETGVEVSPPRDIQVGGQPGVAVDVLGEEDGKRIAARIVVVEAGAKQRFLLIAVAPADKWDAFAPQVDAVLASIHFFPPAEIELPMGGELRQWAASAQASSQYSDPNWSPRQATGAPDTAECGDRSTAWAAASADTVEWIELTYSTPVIPTEVNIYQTYNPNQVVKVELRDGSGNYHTIYEGEPEDMGEDCPYVLTIFVDDADYQAVAVKITIDQSVLQDWNEIDAVELVGTPE